MPALCYSSDSSVLCEPHPLPKPLPWRRARSSKAQVLDHSLLIQKCQERHLPASMTLQTLKSQAAEYDQDLRDPKSYPNPQAQTGAQCLNFLLYRERGIEKLKCV